jgi:hypothetical protein
MPSGEPLRNWARYVVDLAMTGPDSCETPAHACFILSRMHAVYMRKAHEALLCRHSMLRPHMCRSSTCTRLLSYMQICPCRPRGPLLIRVQAQILCSDGRALACKMLSLMAGSSADAVCFCFKVSAQAGLDACGMDRHAILLCSACPACGPCQGSFSRTPCMQVLSHMHTCRSAVSRCSVCTTAGLQRDERMPRHCSGSL